MPDTLVYIGTYTGAKSKSKGIYVFRLQSAGTEVFQNVTLVPLGLAAETPNPSFFELDLKRRLLVAINELDQFDGNPSGAVSAFAIDPNGMLTLLNQRPSMGVRPCHVALSKDGQHAIVVNSGSGNLAVLPIDGAGKIGDATDVVQQRATSTSFDPSGGFVFVCDRDADKVLTYAFDTAAGKLKAQGVTAMKGGSGPRQLVFRPDGKFAYVLNEKQSTITTLAYDAATATFGDVHTISTVPEYFDGPNTATELWVHKSAKWLYVANVGHNSIVLLSIDNAKGTLTYVEEQGTGGRNPRFFALEPACKHLAISNVDSDTVLASRIDEGNGRLKPSGIFADVSSPASIRFLPPAE